MSDDVGVASESLYLAGENGTGSLGFYALCAWLAFGSLVGDSRVCFGESGCWPAWIMIINLILLKITN